MVWVGLNPNVDMKMEYWVCAVWSIRMSGECARLVVCERLYGYETNAGDAFPGVPEMGFIFPHRFQEDFDVDGVSNMFLPRKQCSRLQRIWICSIGSMHRPAGRQLGILAQTNDVPMWQRIRWACDIWCVWRGHQSGGQPWQQINTWQRPSVAHLSVT